MIEIIETEAGFDALQAEWSRLDASDAVHVNQTYDWLRNGWNEQKARRDGGRLWIVKWTGGGDAVIFPFYITKSGVLRFIFESHCDNLGSVCAAKRNLCLCYHELAQAIRGKKEIKRVCLHKIPLHSEVVHYLPILLKGCSVLKDNAYSWLNVVQSENVIESFAHMRSKDRADLKNILRKAGDKTVRMFSASNHDVFPVEAFQELASTMRASGLREAAFFPDSLYAFSSILFERGRIDIAVMFDRANRPIALNFLLRKGRKYLSWIFLYSDLHASTELYVKLLELLAKDGPFEFDFGVGAYSYKIGTFRPIVSPTLGVFWGRTYGQYFLAMKEGLIRCLKDYVKARL